jgi:hypothetical protein
MQVDEVSDRAEAQPVEQVADRSAGDEARGGRR